VEPLGVWKSQEHLDADTGTFLMVHAMRRRHAGPLWSTFLQQGRHGTAQLGATGFNTEPLSRAWLLGHPGAEILADLRGSPQSPAASVAFFLCRFQKSAALAPAEFRGSADEYGY